MAGKPADGDFLGRGWSFPPTFASASGQVLMVQDEQDIRSSLEVLFSTLRGERVMLPLYGCGLHQYVFRSATPALFARLRSELANAILYYEPRITLGVIDIVQTNPLEGRLQITVHYTIRQTNTRSNMVFPFYLAGEGTNVRSLD